MQIPFNFKPRDYQLPLLIALDSGIKRCYCLWHRRAGKDKALWNLVIKKAVEKPGVYYYLFPTYTQAKKVIWDGIDNDGFPFMSHIPKEILLNKDGTALKVEVKAKGGKSIIQLIGTDKYDSIRGTNPVGCVFSEYAFHNPLAWEVIRPILAANGGWAVFNTTPNGKNHAYDLWNMAVGNVKWFTQSLSVAETGIVSAEVLEEEKAEMSREMFQQEYFVSFDVGAVGSVYGEAMETAVVTDLPIHQRATDVYFDLGSADSTSIWFKQDDGQFYNMINYYENSQKKLEHYFEYLDNFIETNLCSLNKIWLPHDSKHNHLGQDHTILAQFQARYGDHRVAFIPALSISGRINKARTIIAKTRFHKDNCKQGINCLQNYRYKYDETKKVYSQAPLHDWSSHGADSFGYFAESVERIEANNVAEEVETMDYSEYNLNPFGIN